MQLLSNIKVGTRLGVLSMVAVLGIGALLGVSLSSLAKLRVGGPIYQEIVTSKDLLADILPPPAYVIESYLNCHEIADITDPSTLAVALEKAKRLRSEYDARLAYWADNLPAGPTKDSLLSQAAVPAKQLFTIRDEQLIPLAQAGKNDEARELVESQIEPLFRTHDAAIRTCVELATKDAARIEQASAASTTRLTGFIWGAAGVLIVAVGVISWLIARSVTRPLSLVRDAVGRLAKGDLTVELKLGHKDEIGQLADSVDHTAGSLRQMIGDVGSTSRQVAAASTQIAASAEEMAAGLKSQEDQTSRLAAAAEQMSASVVEVAKKGQEATQAAETSGQTADNGGTVVQRTIAEMQGISTQVEQSAAAIVDLGARSEQIGRIIGVINDIADQTNLLALNAAIEAARAGEHGRGFAVVADEVRKLAERTTQATDEVARSIRDMQTGTQGAVTKIQEGKTRVTKGVELAQDAGSALNQILISSKQVREMVQSIAVSAAEQSSASSEIARGVESISAVTRESNEAARQSAQAAAELSSQAERLNAMIGRFKV